MNIKQTAAFAIVSFIFPFLIMISLKIRIFDALLISIAMVMFFLAFTLAVSSRSPRKKAMHPVLNRGQPAPPKSDFSDQGIDVPDFLGASKAKREEPREPLEEEMGKQEVEDRLPAETFDSPFKLTESKNDRLTPQYQNADIQPERKAPRIVMEPHTSMERVRTIKYVKRKRPDGEEDNKTD